MWQLWYFGNSDYSKDLSIPPYRFINPLDVDATHLKTRKNVSEAKRVMECLFNYAQSSQFLPMHFKPKDVSLNFSKVQADKLFLKAYLSLYLILYTSKKKRNLAEMVSDEEKVSNYGRNSYITFYDKLHNYENIMSKLNSSNL